MILVVGATGLVGNDICHRLAARGEKVRAFVRSTSAEEKVQALRSAGVEIAVGDLKDPESVTAACRGVDSIISTASSTFSRQAGDSIETVDGSGQLALVSAAKAAGVNRFLFVSFRQPEGASSPLGDAKRAVETAIADMNFTIIQASFFMESWLGAATGFDLVNASARIYGDGTSPISWVSAGDVAEICAVAIKHPAAERRTIEFGGPEALPPLDVVKRLEAIRGKPFTLEYVPVEILFQQFQQATDPMQKTFAALMLGFAHGDAIEMKSLQEEFDLKLTSVEEYGSKALEISRKLATP